MFAAQTGAWRGTGPRPTVKAAIKPGEGQALALREGVAFFFIVARGPSDATRACERVSLAIARAPGL